MISLVYPVQVCLCTVCAVRMSTQPWVFTLEVPISSWKWQESMSWLNSNELLQQNLSASFSLCLFSFLLCSENVLLFFCHSFLCSVPASLLLISSVIFFCNTHLFHSLSPFASALALSFCVGTQLSYYSTCSLQQTPSFSFFLLCTLPRFLSHPFHLIQPSYF